MLRSQIMKKMLTVLKGLVINEEIVTVSVVDSHGFAIGDTISFEGSRKKGKIVKIGQRRGWIS